MRLAWAERTPYQGTCPLLDEILAAGRPDHLLMVDLLRRWKRSDGGPGAGQLVGADRLWNVLFAEQSSQEPSRTFGLPVALR